MFFYLKFFLKCPSLLGFSFPYYNIPRKIRELQLSRCAPQSGHYYNIPRKIRELQPSSRVSQPSINYNIPRKIRELQPIIKAPISLLNYNIPRKIRFLRYLYFNTAWVDFQYYTGYFSALLTYFTIANSRHETTKAGLAIHLKIHIKVLPNSFQVEFFICKLLLISFFIYAML